MVKQTSELSRARNIFKVDSTKPAGSSDSFTVKHICSNSCGRQAKSRYKAATIIECPTLGERRMFNLIEKPEPMIGIHV